jgi:DNA-binding SARP family transcriptional activator
LLDCGGQRRVANLHVSGSYEEVAPISHTYQLRLLGSVNITKDGLPLRDFESRKAVALLGYLARQNRPVERSHLADLFWGDKPEARGRRNLSHELSQLTALLPGVFQADYHTVHCTLATTDWVDTARFELLAATRRARGAARALGHAAQARAAVEASDGWFSQHTISDLDPIALAEAVALYGGEFMAGLYLNGCPDFEIWLIREREYWQRQVNTLLEMLVAYYALRHVDDQALAYARRWLELEPWQEQAHRSLMALLAPMSHPRWVGMQVNFRDLTTWSFLMATAHGAGLMLLPVLLRLPSGVAQAGHDMADHAAHAAHMQMAGAVAAPTAEIAAVVVHTAAP